MNKYDVTEVARAFRANQVEDRHALLQEFEQAVNHNDELKLLIAEVMQEGLVRRHSPVLLAKLCFEFGMALGVCLERRYQRQVL